MTQIAREDIDLKLHHVGVVVADIEKARQTYDLLGYMERTAIIHDPTQTAFVQFFQLKDADHYIELVAPDGPESKLSNASKKRQPLNHLCFSCPDIHATCEALRSRGWLLISAPTPAVAFDQRPIAWLANEAALLVELVERGPEGSL